MPRIPRHSGKPEERCTACNGPVNDRGHWCWWLSERGPIRHAICGDCFDKALASERGWLDVGSRCALKFIEPGGRA
jgi:hypothetical protein